MAVQDRVCGDGATYYNPLDGARMERLTAETIQHPEDLRTMQHRFHGQVGEKHEWHTGLSNAPDEVSRGWLQRYQQLLDMSENHRLQSSLLRHVWRKNWRQDNSSAPVIESVEVFATVMNAVATVDVVDNAEDSNMPSGSHISVCNDEMEPLITAHNSQVAQMTEVVTAEKQIDGTNDEDTTLVERL
jgi:hypothetical protein